MDFLIKKYNPKLSKNMQQINKFDLASHIHGSLKLYDSTLYSHALYRSSSIIEIVDNNMLGVVKNICVKSIENG